MIHKIIIRCFEVWIIINFPLNKLDKIIFYKNFQNFFFFQVFKKFDSNYFFFKKHNFKFISFFKKNLFLLSFNEIFYTTLLHLYFTTIHLINNNYNIFFFNNSFKEINVNLLNLNYFNVSTFNKNFFFFFFKFNFLKNPKHAKKFLFFLNNHNVKLIFFFNTKVFPYILSFLINNGFFLSGLTPIKKTIIFDFPFTVDFNNIFNVYFFYLFFTKLLIYKNTTRLQLGFKNKFIFYSFIDLN